MSQAANDNVGRVCVGCGKGRYVEPVENDRLRCNECGKEVTRMVTRTGDPRRRGRVGRRPSPGRGERA